MAKLVSSNEHYFGISEIIDFKISPKERAVLV